MLLTFFLLRCRNFCRALEFPCFSTGQCRQSESDHLSWQDFKYRTRARFAVSQPGAARGGTLPNQFGAAICPLNIGKQPMVEIPGPRSPEKTTTNVSALNISNGPCRKAALLIPSAWK